MTGEEFASVAAFMGFGAAWNLHELETSLKDQAKARAVEAAKWQRAQRPKLRRENGGWVCTRAYTAVGWGVTPLAAYLDWRQKLTIEENSEWHQ